MQPMPSEADIISATDSLRHQKTAIDGQIVALLKTVEILESMEKEYASIETGSGLATSIAEFLRSYVAGLTETSTNLESAITHNERALQAYRSQILLPQIRPRNIPQ